MKFKHLLAAYILAAASGLMLVSCAAESEIAVMGAKEFQIEDLDQYDLEQKAFYVAESSLPETHPSLPRAANEAVYLHASSRLDGGVVSAALIIAKDVYSESVASPYAELPEGVEVTEVPGMKVRLALGEKAEFEGYAIRFIAARISEGGESQSVFVLEGIPDNVSVFPSGDPSIW